MVTLQKSCLLFIKLLLCVCLDLSVGCVFLFCCLSCVFPFCCPLVPALPFAPGEYSFLCNIVTVSITLRAVSMLNKLFSLGCSCYRLRTIKILDELVLTQQVWHSSCIIPWTSVHSGVLLFAGLLLTVS